MRAVLAAGVLVAFAGAAQAQVVEVPVQPNYVGVGYNVEKTGALVIIAWLYPVGGKVAVCGLVYPEKTSTAIEARQTDILKNLVFSAGGKSLNARATAFSKFPSEEAARAKGTGNCSVTKVPWTDAYAKEKVRMDGRYGYIRG